MLSASDLVGEVAEGLTDATNEQTYILSTMDRDIELIGIEPETVPAREYARGYLDAVRDALALVESYA